MLAVLNELKTQEDAAVEGNDCEQIIETTDTANNRLEPKLCCKERMCGASKKRGYQMHSWHHTWLTRTRVRNRSR